MSRPRAPRTTATASSAAVTALALVLAVLSVMPAQASAPASSEAAARADLPVAGELLVTFGGPATRAADAGVRTARGVRSAQRLSPEVVLIRTRPGEEAPTAAQLATVPGVVAVEPNVRRAFHEAPDDPSYDLQWAHHTTGIEEVWSTTTGGAAIGEHRPLVAVIDSGIDATHPDLAHQVVAQLQVHSGRIVEGEPVNDTCGIGHGTLVAGVIGAQGNNAYGVAGVLWNARIIDIALTDTATLDSGGDPDDCSGPTDADTIAAIQHLTTLEEPPLALNLSLGSSGTQCSTAYQSAIDAARDAGIVVVSSAGNRPGSAPSIPASCNGAISVGAVTRTDRRASYSQRNPYVDLTAPGGQADTCPSTLAELASQNILTTSLFEPRTYQLSVSCQRTFADPNGHRLEAQQGTSFSTPYVTAAVALLRAHALDQGDPLDPDQAEALLEASAVDLGGTGRDDEFGWGRIDVDAAFRLLQDGEMPPLEPDPDFPVASPAAMPERIADAASPDRTDPIAQAIAISRSRLIDHGAPYAVLARVDDYADALAGAAIGMGVGPLLYTGSQGPLDPATREELRRVLRDQGTPATVFVMGGSHAVPAEVDRALLEDGYTVRRIAGSGREETAVRAAAIVEELRAGRTGATRDWVFLTTGAAFPDAVSAGQMAAYYGIPTLLTNPGSLHPSTAAEIRRIAPERVVVVGGTQAISAQTYDAVAALGFPTTRVGGATRIDTALRVFDLYTAALADDGDEALRSAATVAVNLRAGFTDALSATLLAGRGNWYLPLEGVDGGVISPSVREAFCAYRGELVVVGGRDRIREDTVEELLDILAGLNC